MDLHLTSEQTLLRDSAAKFVAAAGPKVARGFRDQEASFAAARLREAGKLGWLGILVPDSTNGLGLGLTELVLVLEQAGRGLVCEPIGLAAISAAACARDVPGLTRAPTSAKSSGRDGSAGIQMSGARTVLPWKASAATPTIV